MSNVINLIKIKGVPILLVVALMTTGLFSCQNVAYAEKVVLSEESYYHLDMGVQLAYNPGCDWGNENVYGSNTPSSVNTTIRFNNDVEVLDTYPLHSSKGDSFDFSGKSNSHNIPEDLGEGSWAYEYFYQNYTSSLITEGNCSSSGNDVSFSYTATLSTTEPLEVVSYGKNGNDQEIYRLFGGKSPLEDDQPEIAAAIETALTAGRNGTAGTNKLYLIFCPNVIEYKKYITVGDLEARLDLPSSAKQGETYSATDVSIVDAGLMVEAALLEKENESGGWEEVAYWTGTGTPGVNTGGRIDESCDQVCSITYRLTVTTTNGQVDTDTKTIIITDGREIDGQAILELPEYTYEGHPALARDSSVFTVDGVSYSARRAYEEEIAENEFLPLPSSAGNAIRESLTTANVAFPLRGSYHVKLEVETASGNTLMDTKPITVRKTPYILDNLGGFQKQNRKQTLNIAVATYPGKPIVDYYIKLRDMETGQEITLTEAQPQQNNATIKTRSVTKNGDDYWMNYELQFLTKVPAYDPGNPDYSQDFRYTIYMKDSKGDTDTVQKTFTVMPDLPPNAQILIQDTFIRNKGTNIAEIEAEDSSTTDGDQLQRTWTVKGIDVQALPGFKDNSFGSRQKILYNKTGVGKETINLSVKDVWNEPTLEEYITAADYKSASTAAITDVINIAPTVRLESVDTEKADVVIFTSKASESAIKAGINSLKAALIEAGIDANVQVLPTAPPNTEPYKKIGNYEWEAAINDQTQRSTGLVFDSDFAYSVEAAGFQVSGYQDVAILPYTVKALKRSGIEGGQLTAAWSYTVTQSTDFQLKLGGAGDYVYLACNDTGKTVLLNRNNGAYVTALPIVIPSSPFATPGNNSLYFLASDKIQKFDPGTGTLKTVINHGGSMGSLQNGKITFIEREAERRYNLCQFDMKSEELIRRSIPELPEYLWDSAKSDVSPTDYDSTGKVTFAQTLKTDGDITGIVIWLADTKTQKVYSLGKVASPNDMRANSLGFVKDETGKARYMYHAYSDDDSTTSTTRRYFHAYIYTLGDGDTAPVRRTIYSEKNNRNNWSGIAYAKYHTQENAIYLMQANAFQAPDWGGNVFGVQAKISLPSWTADFASQNWGWDIATEDAGSNDFMMMTGYDYDSWTSNLRGLRMFTKPITKDQAEESALTRLASLASDATQYIERNYTGQIQDLVGKIKSAIKEKTSVKITATGGGQINLTRTFQMKPNQTYYYEYEIKNPDVYDTKLEVKVPEIIFNQQTINAGAENLGSYYVSKIYTEDFNDSAIDPFFTVVSGVVNGKFISPPASKGSSNYNVSATGTIEVSIPAGKKAIAIMDTGGYTDSTDTNNYAWKSGLYVNGMRYDKAPRVAADTTRFDAAGYVHPYILNEGTNTIEARCMWYGRGTDGYYASIDNLKILLLESTPQPSASTFSSGLTEEGWTKVTGSFKTPQEISEFKAQTMIHYPNWPPGYHTYTAVDEDGYETGIAHAFTIPAGKKAKIYAMFNGSQSRSSGTAGTFSCAGFAYTHVGKQTWRELYVQSGERFFVGEVGSTEFYTTTPYGGSVNFTRLETYVYPGNLSGTNAFFFEGGKVFSKHKTYDGNTNVKIRLETTSANSELLLQNLKIYYINNGSRVYVYSQPLKDTLELNGWEVSESVGMYTETKPEKEEDAPLVYKKGQLVAYQIFYDDYEKDPSKKQYWRYTHTPYNDGSHPDAAVILDEDGAIISDTGKILSESIPRFYVDGKYTVEHWQEDNTDRVSEIAGEEAPGESSGETDYTKYDKLSNVESITFYVEGGGAAPWITSIKTDPATVREGDSYQLQIGVDDEEKDVLRLTTELYKDKKLIYTHRRAEITADSNGIYPLIITGYPPLAEPGKYEAVCTVRDWSGAGMGSYRFIVVSEGKITGFVNHTDQWDENRKKYNLKRFSEEVNRPLQLNDYLAMPMPRMRGTNVFWSGEKFLLRGETEGTPQRVEVLVQTLDGQGNRKSTGYAAVLADTGRKTSAGAGLWEGSLWDKGMINKWGRKAPEQLVFVFTAHYAGGKTKTYEVMVIVDSRQDYWQLHRLW